MTFIITKKVNATGGWVLYELLTSASGDVNNYIYLDTAT